LKTQRDEFLDLLFERAQIDSSICLLSVDMGAPAIDKWKTGLPNQYLEMGISEQNAINVAAGLSRGGKKVFLYFMSVWVHRCFEQIRYSCAIGGNKITILGNGVGLGYAPAGPAHEPNEDVAVMRTLHKFNIYSGSSTSQMKGILEECLSSENSNYVRLERKVHSSAEDVHVNLELESFSPSYSFDGSVEPKVCVLSYGQIIRRVFELKKEFPTDFEKVRIIELSKLFPLEVKLLLTQLGNSKRILIIEEQSRSGSIAESIALEFSIRDLTISISTIHLPSSYIFENGNQDELLDMWGFSKNEILDKIRKLTFLDNEVMD